MRTQRKSISVFLTKSDCIYSSSNNFELNEIPKSEVDISVCTNIALETINYNSWKFTHFCRHFDIKRYRASHVKTHGENFKSTLYILMILMTNLYFSLQASWLIFLYQWKRRFSLVLKVNEKNDLRSHRDKMKYFLAKITGYRHS